MKRRTDDVVEMGVLMPFRPDAKKLIAIITNLAGLQNELNKKQEEVCEIVDRFRHYKDWAADEGYDDATIAEMLGIKIDGSLLM